MRDKTIGISLVVVAAVFFGINGSLSRLLFDSGVTPLTLVEFRMIVGALCIGGFLCIRQRRALKLPRRSLGWLLAFGLSMALVTYTYFVSISRLPIAGQSFPSSFQTSVKLHQARWRSRPKVGCRGSFSRCGGQRLTSARMSLVIHPLNLTGSQLRITLRSGKPLVPQHLLNRPQVGTLLQHMRTERMPKRMRVHIGRQSAASSNCLDDAAHAAGR